jgi:hypothetical protein
MFTAGAVVLTIAIAWWVARLNLKDRESRNVARLTDDEVRTAVLRTRLTGREAGRLLARRDPNHAWRHRGSN